MIQDFKCPLCGELLAIDKVIDWEVFRPILKSELLMIGSIRHIINYLSILQKNNGLDQQYTHIS